MTKRRPWAARRKLAENRDTLLRQYCANGGDMRDHERIRQATGLSPTEINEAVKRLDLEHTKDT
jgi:hypothetical protein